MEDNSGPREEDERRIHLGFGVENFSVSQIKCENVSLFIAFSRMSMYVVCHLSIFPVYFNDILKLHFVILLG